MVNRCPLERGVPAFDAEARMGGARRAAGGRRTGVFDAIRGGGGGGVGGGVVLGLQGVGFGGECRGSK